MDGSITDWRTQVDTITQSSYKILLKTSSFVTTVSAKITTLLKQNKTPK